MMRSAFDVVSAWASVLATTNSTPCRPLAIMLLTALPPAPPVPNTVIRGLSSRISGIFRLMLISASSYAEVTAASDRSAAIRWNVVESSEALAQPSSDPCDIAAACCRVPRCPRFEMLEMCRLRVNQQPGRDRESRPLCLFGQAADAKRSADPHRTAQDLRGKPRQSGELARAAGENDAAARLGRERRSRQAVAHHFENLFDARFDDTHQVGARHEARRLDLALNRRHGDHVALVGAAGEHAAVKRL